MRSAGTVRPLLRALLLSSISMLLHGQLSAPRVGLVRYANGGVYPIFGVPGNYVVGKQLFATADALSFSDAGGLLARDGRLLLLDQSLTTIASFNTSSSLPVVGIGAKLNSAIAWLPSSHTLVHWNGSALVPVAVPQETVNGEVFSVAKIGMGTALLRSRSATGTIEESTVSLESGALVTDSGIPGAVGVLYQQGDLILSVQDGQLLQTSTISATRKATPIRADDIAFERVSETCVHLHARRSGRDWLVHLSPDALSLYELPSPPAASLAVVVSP